MMLFAAQLACSTIDVAVQHESEAMERTFPEQKPAGFLDEEKPEEQNTLERIRVVVMPIEVKGERWGGQFSDAIALHLMKTGKFDVLERSYLERVLREQHLHQTGLIDPDTGAKITPVVQSKRPYAIGMSMSA